MEEIELPVVWNGDVREKSNGLCTTKFKENQSFIICGRSGSGKTTFIRKLLEHAKDMFDGHREIWISYLYKSFQPMFYEMEQSVENIIFHKGLLSQDEILSTYSDNGRRHLIIVMDDLMRETADSGEVSDFFYNILSSQRMFDYYGNT